MEPWTANAASKVQTEEEKQAKLEVGIFSTSLCMRVLIFVLVSAKAQGRLGQCQTADQIDSEAGAKESGASASHS